MNLNLTVLPKANLIHRRSLLAPSLYTALHCTALHYTALHCIALHCTALHCTSLHCTTLLCIALHRTTRHFTALTKCRILPVNPCTTCYSIAVQCFNSLTSRQGEMFGERLEHDAWVIGCLAQCGIVTDPRVFWFIPTKY